VRGGRIRDGAALLELLDGGEDVVVLAARAEELLEARLAELLAYEMR
jgi:3-deoxy-D-manno-octulosonate 8-phosphate phosphatase KdsC-like HAD superfamily phosphatase